MILVVGGTGTLGSYLVKRLSAARRPVRVLSRAVAPRPRGSVDGPVEYAVGDVRERDSLTPAFEGVDLVVSAMHGFTGTAGNSPASVDRVGNFNVIAAAAAAGADMIMLSVVGAAPDSSMELFRMKWEAEERLRASAVSWTIVRATAFAQTWIELLERTGQRSGRPLVFGKGTNPINFVSADDVAAVTVRTMEDRAQRGKTIVVAGPRSYTFCELATLVQAQHGWSGRPRHVPRPMLRLMRLMGPVAPTVARMGRSALVMDTLDLQPGELAEFRELMTSDVAAVLADNAP